jgi:hypothetical protein
MPRSKQPMKRRRCTCGYPGVIHMRKFCNPNCKKCNEDFALAERSYRRKGAR